MDTVRKLALPLILLAAVLGVAVGLFLGWQVWPVQWYDTDPSDLRLSHQQTYVEMVADSMAVTGEAETAARRLLELTDDDTSWAQVANLVEGTAQVQEKQGNAAAALRIRRMAQLAQLPAASGEAFQPVASEGGLPTRTILLIAAIAVFVIALAMLIWVIIRLLRNRKPRRDALGPIPQAPKVDGTAQPVQPTTASRPAAILWEEEVVEEADEDEPAPSAPAYTPRPRPVPPQVNIEPDIPLEPEGDVEDADEPETALETEPEIALQDELVDEVVLEPAEPEPPYIAPVAPIVETSPEPQAPPRVGLVPESMSSVEEPGEEPAAPEPEQVTPPEPEVAPPAPQVEPDAEPSYDQPAYSEGTDDDDLEAIFDAAFGEKPLYKQSKPEPETPPEPSPEPTFDEEDDTEDQLESLLAEIAGPDETTIVYDVTGSEGEQSDETTTVPQVPDETDETTATIELTTDETRRMEGAVGAYEAEYRFGDDDFDCSFTIETPSGEFLGECGVGISDVLSAEDGQKVNAFEVWLFDKSDIRTVSKVLVSQHSLSDHDLNARLSAKGDLVVARQSSEILLETLTLQVSAVVIGFGYRAEEPRMATFDHLEMRLVARQVD